MLLGTALADHDKFPYYLGALILIALASPWYMPKAKRLDLLALPLIYGAGYYLEELLTAWLKGWFNYPRPLLALDPASVHVLGEPRFHHSFPSGHTAFAALLAASVWPVLGLKGRIAAAIFVLWVGLSRMALGMHFPTDVLGGTLVSIIACGFLWNLYGFAKRKVTS